MEDVVVHKNRTNVLQVDLGFDVSLDTITSKIRKRPNIDATLVATWDVAFSTDGTDGLLVFTLDDSVLTDPTLDPTIRFGYMDIKRVSAGEPLPVFSQPIKVIFKDTVTQ